jgi:hypothetical protein
MDNVQYCNYTKVWNHYVTCTVSTVYASTNKLRANENTTSQAMQQLVEVKTLAYNVRKNKQKMEKILSITDV